MRIFFCFLSRGAVAWAGRAMAKFVWALDFDGVLCDSVDETGLSGWRTCARVFGDKMSRLVGV